MRIPSASPVHKPQPHALADSPADAPASEDLPPSLSIAQRVALLKESGRRARAPDAPPAQTPPQADDPLLSSTISQRQNVLRESQALWKQRTPAKDVVAPSTPPVKIARPAKAPPSSGLAQSTGQPLGSLFSTPKAAPAPQPRQPSPPPAGAPPSLDEGLKSFFSSSASQPPPAASAQPPIDSAAIDQISGQAQRLTTVRKAKPPRRLAGASKGGAGAQPSPPAPRTPAATEKGEDGCRPGTRVLCSLEGGGPRQDLAPEARAGLSSREDWSTPEKFLRRMELSRRDGTPGDHLLNHTEAFVVLVKGRPPSLRLVAPRPSSLSPHCAALFRPRPTSLLLYHGPHSNLLERAKVAEVGRWVAETRDMGSSASCSPETVTDAQLREGRSAGGPLGEFLSSCESEAAAGEAWGEEAERPAAEAEAWDALVWAIQRLWRVDEEGTQRLEAWTGRPLRQHILHPDRVFVLDFCSELYVWSGTNASMALRQRGLDEATRLWARDFDPLPAPCIHPLSLELVPESQGSTGPIRRPCWGILAPQKDGMETALFQGKFVDWEASGPLCKSRSPPRWSPPKDLIPKPLSTEALVALKDPGWEEAAPEDVAERLFRSERTEPRLLLEGEDLGRGLSVRRDGENRLRDWDVVTEAVRVFRVLSGGTTEAVPDSMVTQLCGDSCYVVRWGYRLRPAHRKTLRGEDSRQGEDSGRQRLAFFYWQGREASKADKGCCGLAIRSLDKDQSPQVRVPEGEEPPAFLRLFQGRLVITRPSDENSQPPQKLFILAGGPFKEETALRELPAQRSNLRSHGVYLLADLRKRSLTSWLGSRSSGEHREWLEDLIEGWLSSPPNSVFGSSGQSLSCGELEEGREPSGWLGTEPYPRPWPAEGSNEVRLFQLLWSGGSEVLGAREVESVWRSRTEPPPVFPFSVGELRAQSRPAFLLLAQGWAGGRLVLWEGAPDEAEESGVSARLPVFRKLALRVGTALARLLGASESLVVAEGAEPDGFRALFPLWEGDVAAAGVPESLAEALEAMSPASLPLAVLQTRPLPPGVDPDRLDDFLSADDFAEAFGMAREDFRLLPAWKKTQAKRDAKLF